MMLSEKFRNTTATALALAFLVRPGLVYASSPSTTAPNPSNVVRYSASYVPANGGPSTTVYFAALDGDSLMNGLPAVFEGYVADQANGENIPFTFEVPKPGIDSITVSPMAVNGPSPMTRYQLHQDGVPIPYELEMETTNDPLKSNSFIHSGAITNTDTGDKFNFVAHNDPVPVVAVIAGAAVLLFCGAGIVKELVDDCTDQAIRACKPRGVKKVTTKITF
ncbi:MAG: hypothetical protein AAFZ18_30165, partial [Myxococcota bacterium]